MNTNKGVKSYSSCYLYNKIPDYERSIMAFVMKSERINKQSESFRGIIEDVKRRQSTAVISRILMRDDVVLCINNRPMPAAFKVFACSDVKEDRACKVFIDCTGLITLKNGYFVADKIDILCTYLLGAMDYIVYQTDDKRITSNSSIIQTGTECFVALSSHIFDYFRPNGYAENKNKIAYILGMYFQINLLGLEHDQSSCTLAARVAGLKQTDVRALEVYYTDEMLINIDALVTGIANTFRMKGMATDVFVERWTWFYGVGTQFAMELFSAFAVMLTNAYCGSYVNNQKSIEKCCGRSMVDFTNAMIRIGGESIDRGYKYESAMDRDVYDHRKVLREFLNSDHHQVTRKLTVDDYSDLKKLNTALDDIVKNSKNDKDKSKKIYTTFYGGTTLCDMYIFGEKYQGSYPNIQTTICKQAKNHCTIKDKNKIIDILQRAVTNMTKMINEKDGRIKSMANAKKVLSDAKSALKILDPSNAVLKESDFYYYNRVEPFKESAKVKDAINSGAFGKVLQGAFGSTNEGFLDKMKAAGQMEKDLKSLNQKDIKSYIDSNVVTIQSASEKGEFASNCVSTAMRIAPDIYDYESKHTIKATAQAAKPYLSTRQKKELLKAVKMSKVSYGGSIAGGAGKFANKIASNVTDHIADDYDYAIKVLS